MSGCYMSGRRVAGFAHQRTKGLIPPPPEGPDSPEAQPGRRIMHGPDAPSFQALRALMENEWTPQMMKTLGIDEPSLPVLGTRGRKPAGARPDHPISGHWF